MFTKKYLSNVHKTCPLDGSETEPKSQAKEYSLTGSGARSQAQGDTGRWRNSDPLRIPAELPKHTAFLYIETMQCETSRLVLRQWRDSDYEPFADLSADPEVMRYFPSTYDRRGSDALVDRYRSLIDERGWGLFAVERKKDGQLLGFTGLHEPTTKLPFTPCVEIGWRFARQYWGKGYATEAAGEVLRLGFMNLKLPEIVSFAVALNKKSRAVMQRLGMRDTGRNFEHPAFPLGHPMREHCLYTLARRDWLRMHPAGFVRKHETCPQ